MRIQIFGGRCHGREGGRDGAEIGVRSAAGVLVPVEGDLIGVVGEAFLVRVLVVVEIRGEVDQERGLVADGFEPVPAVTGDPDDFLAVFADDERVEFALRGGVLAVVVDADLDSSLGADEVVDLSAVVFVPGARDARIGHRVVGHRRVGVVLVPVFPVGFDEVAASVGIYLEISESDIVYMCHIYRIRFVWTT